MEFPDGENNARGAGRLPALWAPIVLTVLIMLPLLALPLPGEGAARAETGIRLLAGAGKTRTGFDFPEMQRDNSHTVVQLLFYVQGDPFRRAPGLEIGRHVFFRTPTAVYAYTSIGLFVEATFFGILVGQLGTVGYFAEDDSLGGADGNSAGFRASIGVEPSLGKPFFLSFRIRQDLVFEEERISAGSLEAGIGARF